MALPGRHQSQARGYALPDRSGRVSETPLRYAGNPVAEGINFDTPQNFSCNEIDSHLLFDHCLTHGALNDAPDGTGSPATLAPSRHATATSPGRQERFPDAAPAAFDTDFCGDRSVTRSVW